jgi:DNA-binding CsgD family transcriptional regulator
MGSAPVAGSGKRWLVVSDCWLAGVPLFRGTILDLDPDSEKDAANLAALQRAGRLVQCTREVCLTFQAELKKSLTPRERQIVEATESSYKQIAARIGISPRTVNKHFQSIYAKLHRPGRTSAALFWQAWIRTRF